MTNQNYQPYSENEEMANRIANALDDLKCLHLYIKFCNIYPHDVLIDILEYVLEVPENKIKRSKGAFFTYLVKRYSETSTVPIKEYQ